MTRGNYYHQAQANVTYRERVYQRFIERGLSSSKATEKADAAAMRYAGRQHRYRAETITNTELAFAYNRGAHMGVGQSIANGYMGKCEMVWSTAGTNRVCSRCMELRGKVVGTTEDSGAPVPPLHPRCRCTIMYREVEPAKALRTNSELNKPNIESNESFRLIIPELPYKPVSEERYNQLIIPLKKMGVTIMRGGEEVERHLDFMNAEASNFGKDLVFFREKISVSAILEETHHIIQNRQGLNNDKDEPVRSWLNEIDAKKYLLRVAQKYGIPRDEILITKKQIENYEKLLKEWEDEKVK